MRNTSPSSGDSSSNGANNDAAGGTGGLRPGDARRRYLNDQLLVPTVSNFFSIERYYDAADKVFDSFQAALAAHDLDAAYLYGKRYCTFCVDAIPTHHYFTSEKYKHLQSKHRPQVDLVLLQLAQLNERMDEEEREKAEREEREQLEALEKRASQFTTATTGSNNSQTTTSTDGGSSSNKLELSALNKLDMLRTSMNQKRTEPTAPSASSSTTIKRDPSGETAQSSSRYRLTSEDEEDSSMDGEEEKKSCSNNNSLPAPILPPTEIGAAAPPSYHQAMAEKQRHPAAHPNGVNSTTTLDQHPQLQKRIQQNYYGQEDPKQPPQKRKPMRKLQEEYRKAFVEMTAFGKIEVTGINTWQGRRSASTNGCTVISALVAATHLATPTNGGITDRAVEQVIDDTCGPILKKIRRKLGLGDSALIIPSDVHDYLVDEHILKQDWFEGAAGGNVTDPNHVGEFLKLLAVGNDGKGAHRKAAATFFFHEHVISIVKIPNPNTASSNNHKNSATTAVYDLIDSLPGLRNGDGRATATRTRCEGIDALAILLRWYTSRKFSDANCAHIDRNPWDDALADVDPRVFQGFVWSSRTNQQRQQQ